jgi:hypothetical protein
MKLLKSVLLALLFSLLLGLSIGTVLRLHIERSVYYIGSAIAPQPLDVGDTRPPVLDTRHHKEQIG